MKMQALVISVLIGCMSHCAIDGLPDSSFGIDGAVTSNFGDFTHPFTAQQVAVQPDGKIVAVGYVFISSIYYVVVARYNVDGTLDTSFGTQGVNKTSVIGAATSAVIQPNGQIVVFGNTETQNFVLVRFNTDGSLDTTFNSAPASALLGQARAMALQADGKIVAAAGSSSGGNSLIYRFNSDGSIDTTFTIVNTNLGYSYTAFDDIAVQQDGKIVVFGSAENVNGCMLVARYLPTGMIDTTFGTNGFTTISLTILGDYGYSGAIQADGKLIVAGTVDDDSYMGFARLTSQGLLDPSFGSGGKIATSMPGVTYGINFQTDGKIILVGLGGSGYNQGTVLRYTTSGVLDPSFAQGGVSLTVAGTTFTASAINATGKIIALGNNGNSFALNQYVVDSLHYSPLSQAIWKVYYNQLN